MPYTVVNLPVLSTPTTSSTYAGMSSAAGSLWTSVSGLGIGLLDDASSITLYFTSSATGLTSASVIQVSQFDPFLPPPVGVTQSTNWFTYSLTSTTAGFPLVSSSGVALTITNVSFRGIRISMLGSANTANDIIAFASKQISV